MISSHVPYPGVCWGELGISAEQHPSCAIPENATAAGYLHTMGSLDTPDLGQVAGVHVGYGGDASKVLIFHRAGRVMEAFDHADKIEEEVNDQRLDEEGLDMTLVGKARDSQRVESIEAATLLRMIEEKQKNKRDSSSKNAKHSIKIHR